ncbi:MAG: SDR family oxidoreductase [candidate division KSB1 bacterium]|nr:SDR family oxidoreductase [candidate division KSB1 bacterium]
MSRESIEAMERLSAPQKVALVTAGAKRLGQAIALGLAGKGFQIVVHYHRSRLEAEETVQKIHNLGSQAIALQADVSKEKEVQQLVQQAQSELGAIDLLVNNAAIFPSSPWPELSERLWDETLAVNLKGPFLCAKAVSDSMLQRKEGKIINIASLGGIVAYQEHIAYSVSKAGLIMLTKCLAKALAPHVTVNAIAPGYIDFSNGEDQRNSSKIPLSRIPLQRYGQAQDVVDLVIFLATQASYITGQTFIVDGGRSLFSTT